MPLRDWLCLECSHVWEEFNNTPDTCPHCETIKIEKLPCAAGGYRIHGSNTSSTRPKNSGSFKKASKK